MPMTMDKFQTFCRTMPAVAEGGIVDQLYADLEKAMNSLMVATYARDIAMYASMGVAVVNLCENPKIDSIRAQVMKLVKKIVNPIVAVINKVSVVMITAYLIKQAWDTIPTWEEIAKMVEDEIQKLALSAIRLAISELISVVVCGNKFQRLAVPQLTGMVSDQLVILTVLSALKTSFETYETM
jgi:hypothetical protein